jgi:two-component system sensor histidine kinase KdpD
MKRPGLLFGLIPDRDARLPEGDEGAALPEGYRFQQYWRATWAVLGITLPTFLVSRWTGQLPVALIYLLAVVAMALFFGRGATMYAAVLSALFWDFFFVKPVSHFRIATVEDASMIGLYLVIALVLGEIAARLTAQERATRHAGEEATALYGLVRGLAEAGNLDELERETVRLAGEAFESGVVVLLKDPLGRLSFHAHPASTYDMPGPEQPVADRAFEEGRMTGRFTKIEPKSEALYVPLVTARGVVGVMGLAVAGEFSLTRRQQRLLDVFAQHIALALERHQSREESGRIRSRAEAEALGRVLLNSMSHEIRDPVAAIRSAATKLAGFGDIRLTQVQQAILGQVEIAAELLDRLAGKVHDVNRLESGQVLPNLEMCNVPGLLNAALRESRRELARHKVELHVPPKTPPVRMDFDLMRQALGYLLANAVSHTPAGTVVNVSARVRDGFLLISVADRGPGIPLEAVPRVFDKFYRASESRPGGTGLGLSVVKGFVECQGGEVHAANRHGGGAVFTIRLPVKAASVVAA